MNWLDILLLIVVGLHIFNGFSRGLVKQIFDIIGFLVIILLSFWGSRMFSDYVARYISPEDIIPQHEVIEILGLESMVEQAPQLVAGVVVFLALLLVLSLVFRIFSGGFRWINRIPVVGLFNRAAGAVLGVAIGILFAYIIIAGIALIPMQLFVDALENSEAVFITERYLTPLIVQLKDIALNFYVEFNNLNG